MLQQKEKKDVFNSNIYLITTTVKFDINIVKEVMTYENKKKNSSFVAANNEFKLGNVPK